MYKILLISLVFLLPCHKPKQEKARIIEDIPVIMDQEQLEELVSLKPQNYDKE